MLFGPAGAIEGAAVATYLLEKSRLVTHAPGVCARREREGWVVGPSDRRRVATYPRRVREAARVMHRGVRGAGCVTRWRAQGMRLHAACAPGACGISLARACGDCASPDTPSPPPARGAGERGYHVFYELCAGANKQQQEQLKLLPAREYPFLFCDPEKEKARPTDDKEDAAHFE
eukprot:4547996-Prymnesium_polylepis.1